jgi:putative tricarboxylic transport membrane protein
MKFNDALVGLLLAALGAAIIVYARGFPAIHGQQYGPGVFPSLIAVTLIICAAILVWNGWRARATQRWFDIADWVGSRRHLGAFWTVVGAAIAYILFSEMVGFFVMGTAILLTLFLVLRVRPAVAAVTAVVATGVIWYAFYKLLRVPLPWGIFTFMAF